MNHINLRVLLIFVWKACLNAQKQKKMLANIIFMIILGSALSFPSQDLLPNNTIPIPLSPPKVDEDKVTINVVNHSNPDDLPINIVIPYTPKPGSQSGNNQPAFPIPMIPAGNAQQGNGQNPPTDLGTVWSAAGSNWNTNGFQRPSQGQNPGKDYAWAWNAADNNNNTSSGHGEGNTPFDQMIPQQYAWAWQALNAGQQSSGQGAGQAPNGKY